MDIYVPSDSGAPFSARAVPARLDNPTQHCSSCSTTRIKHIHQVAQTLSWSLPNQDHIPIKLGIRLIDGLDKSQSIQAGRIPARQATKPRRCFEQFAHH